MTKPAPYSSAADIAWAELMLGMAKAALRRRRGRPVKWTYAARTQLHHEYQALKAGGMRREAVLSFLQAHYCVGRKAIEKELSR